MSIVYQRQNEDIAIHYLKASEYCFRKEKLIKYSIMIISVLLTAVGVLIKFMPHANAITSAISNSAKYLTFGSGVFVVASIFLNKKATKFHIEGVNILELYDNYVFGLPNNPTILRPINELTISNYAARYGKNEHKLRDFYFASPEAEPRGVTFNRYGDIYGNDFHLLTRITNFYYTIWVGFIVIILFFAVYVDETFVESLSNILIPSLSAITLIFNAWYSMNEDKNFLQRTIKYITEVSAEVKKGTVAATSPLLLRSLQDGLFSYRMRSFTVPVFLVKSFKRSQQRQLNRQAKNQLLMSQMTKAPVSTLEIPSLPVKQTTTVAKRPQVALSQSQSKPKTTSSPKPKSTDTQKVSVVKKEVTPKVEPKSTQAKKPATKAAPKETTAKVTTTKTAKETTTAKVAPKTVKATPTKQAAAKTPTKETKTSQPAVKTTKTKTSK